MVTVIRDDRSTTTGGRASARQLSVMAVLVAVSLVCVPAASGQTVPVSVHGERGLYRVSATFTTPQPAAIGHAVLTDYEQIPRFLPDVLSSHVLERDAGRTVVAQEAVAKVLFFSKRVRLVLEIHETPTFTPAAATAGKPNRPDVDVRAVVPTVTVFHDTPRLALIASLTAPVELSV